MYRTCLPLRENPSHESITCPSSERVTTCQGMNLEMLPISNVASSNFQFQSTYAKATADKLELATFSE